MKRFYLFLLSTVLLFSSCGDSESTTESNPNDGTLKKLTGVWISSEDLFLSFNSEGEYAAFVDYYDLQTGVFTYKDNIITCKNSNNNTNTSIQVKAFTENEISVDIEYTDIYGDLAEVSEVFKKWSTIEPSSSLHKLKGKTYDWGDAILSFDSYNRCSKTTKFDSYYANIEKDEFFIPKGSSKVYNYVYITPYIYIQDWCTVDEYENNPIHYGLAYGLVDRYKIELSKNGEIEEIIHE